MNTNLKTLNMKDELYMNILRDSVTYCIPAGHHYSAVKALRRAMTGDEKMCALDTLLKVCNAEGCFREGLKAIDKLISDPDLSEHRSRLLFWAGEMSAGLFEYDKATGYYARSLSCIIRTKEQHLETVIKLGSCSLFRRNFQEAEEWSRWAIKLAPYSWEA
jgi:tetratricopeptide (TPR) repeat protein